MNSLTRTVYRCVGSAVSSSWQGRKLSVLLYHRVLADSDPLRPDEFNENDFRLHMQVLSDCFTVLPLDQAVKLLKRSELPPRAVSITFDDGYADNESVALPILSDLGLTATFFVASGFLDGGRMWNDSVIEAVREAECGTLDLSDLGLGVFEMNTIEQRITAINTLLPKLKYQSANEREKSVSQLIAAVGKSLPTDLMMTSAQVQQLAKSGMTIGAHTVNHPILRNLADKDVQLEIIENREALENITGLPVKMFAYPNGRPNTDYGRRDINILDNLGFEVAVSTAWGVCSKSSDFHQLPRFTPWDRTRDRFALRMLQNYSRTHPDAVK